MKIINFVLLALSLGTSHTLLARSYCDNEVDEMRAQIWKNGSIHTVEDTLLTNVDNPRESTIDKSVCFADGYNAGAHACILTWNKYDWGKTLKCFSY